MASRSGNINNVITPNSIALNAFIYGYGGHSLVTPHHAIQQIWWTQDRIEERVTRDFVFSKLRPNQRDRLDRELSFGDGLTSDTYLDWILEKARRLFLVLEELGIADQIFTVIDHSWDDEDLPLSFENVQQLSISYQIHEQLDRKFYDTQFRFLLRELREGAHFDYGPGEIIPLEYIHKVPPAVALQHWNRVHLPAQPDTTYVRRKIPLENISVQELLMDIETSRFVEHPHIAPIWASYTSKNVAYFLTPFVSQHTLKSFIDQRSPPQWAKLNKHDRGLLLLNWLHCLASAITALHASGFIHTKIRPSNILIDAENDIAFADIGSLKSFQKDKKVDNVEAYNYAAPEVQSFTVPPSNSDSVSEKSVPPPSRGSSDNGLPGNSPKMRGKKLSSSFAFDFGFDSKANNPKSKKIGQLEPCLSDHTEASDMFSLGCVFLDIITFMMRRKASDFVKHRNTKVKVMKENPTFLDKPKKASSTRLDGSFHRNPAKVESWTKLLEEQAFELDDNVYRVVPHILRLVRGMMARDPFDRPEAFEVRDGIAQILANYANIRQLHCPTRFPKQTPRPHSPISGRAYINPNEDSFYDVDPESIADLSVRPFGILSHGATAASTYDSGPELATSPPDSPLAPIKISHPISHSPIPPLPPLSPLGIPSLSSSPSLEDAESRKTSNHSDSPPQPSPHSYSPHNSSYPATSNSPEHVRTDSPHSLSATLLPSTRARSSTDVTHASSITAYSASDQYSHEKLFTTEFAVVSVVEDVFQKENYGNTHAWTDAASMTSSMASPTAGIIRDYAETIHSQASVSTDTAITARIMEERRAKIEEAWRLQRQNSRSRKSQRPFLSFRGAGTAV